MSLSREQHNEIMRIIDDRRFAALRAQSRREAALREELPAVGICIDNISRLSMEEAAARLRKDIQSADKLRQERLAAVAARKKLIKDAGYPADQLEVHYYCQRCGDTGYTGSTKCGCFKQLESELLNRESGLPAIMQRENFGTLDTHIYDRSTVIDELLPRRMTQYDYMTRRGGILDRIRGYVEDFEDGGSHNILMFGAAGTGKTFLSNCIARSLIDRQHSVSYSRAGDMFSRMSKSEFSRAGSPEAESISRREEECELLIIDDLGTEFATEFTRAKLFSVISNRLSHGTSTIISTNLSMNQLCECYGERVSSRFMGEYMLLPFYGADLRLSRKKGN